LKTPNKHHW
jgi:serine/threonine protein phosphatase PrpC